MIDPKVFAELQNHGIITNVGLSAADFKNLDELKNYGLATSMGTDEVYNNALNKSNYLDSFLEEIVNGGYITLDGNIILNKPIIIEKDVTIDLNGYSISNIPWDEDGESNAYIFWVKNGKLTITGNGTVSAHDAYYSMAVWANGGDVEINGGTYKNSGDACDLIYISKKGNVKITGGEFIPGGPAAGKEPGTKNLYPALNIKDANRDTCSFTVVGGKFFKFNPADNVSETEHTNFCGTGYTAVAVGDWYNVVEGVSTEEELKKIVLAGGKTKLVSDITLTDYIEVRSDLTVDLNGHKIVHPIDSTSKYPDVFEVYSNGKLTILGDGEVNAENGYAVYAAGDSTVIIDGGLYMSPVSAVDARKNANVTINGGIFKVDGSNNKEGDFGQKFTLNLRDKTGNYVSDKSIITVKGGKFYKYNPAASESEPEITNFVAKGYESVQEGDWFVVKEAKDIIVDEGVE